MRILNELDEEMMEDDVDLELGRLEQDFVFVKFHEGVPAEGEEGHYKVGSVIFSDGTEYVPEEEDIEHIDENFNFVQFGDYIGKEVVRFDLEYVIDKEYVPAIEPWYENEEIKRYILYTEEELKQFDDIKRQQIEKAEIENKRSEFFNSAPQRLTDVELSLTNVELGLTDAEVGIVDSQEAIAELGVLASDNSVSIEDLMDAIAELGAIVAGE